MSRGRVVGVVGASGGIGASTVVVGVGRQLVRAGASAVCVDARPLGGGLDVVAGLDEQPGCRWDGLRQLSGTVDGLGLLAQLPRIDQVPVLSHGRFQPAPVPWASLAAVVAGLTAAVSWCLIDLPSLDETWVRRWEGLLDELILVCGADEMALAAATVVAEVLETSALAVSLVQRAARVGSPMGQIVADALGLPLLAVIPDDAHHLRKDLERAQLPGSCGGPFARACAQIASGLTTDDRTAVAVGRR